jgi:N utilization substance protein A
MKDAERDVIYEEFKDRQGQIIHGIVQRVDRAGIIVTLGRAEALLPIREQVPREAYRPGDRIRAFVLEVNRAGKGPQIILSRSHSTFLIQLFTAEVPELGEGIVKIMSVAREPGSRAKVAVTSSDPDIDPVGACVGMRGSRVQAVSQELRGEKIDIIKYDPDPVKFVCNGLQPAIISKVVLDQVKRVMLIIVKDDQLSQAIGRKGQNVRLASQLTGWDLDVVSESRYSKASADGYNELLTLRGVGSATADALFDAGWQSVQELADAPPDELATIPGVGLTKAADIIGSAKERIETLDAQEAEADGAGGEVAEASAEETAEEPTAEGAEIAAEEVAEGGEAAAREPVEKQLAEEG